MRGAEGEGWERHRGGVGGVGVQNGRDEKGGRGRGGGVGKA